MAFGWVQDITPGAPANAAGLNEIQANLDTIYAALGITRTGCASGAGWTEFPLVGGLVDPKLSVQPQQLLAATDYAYDNKCPAHDISVQTGYENADKIGVDGSYYPGYDSTYRYSYDNDEDTGYNSGDQAGVDSSDYPGYCNDENIYYHSGHLYTVESSHFPGLLLAENTDYT